MLMQQKERLTSLLRQSNHSLKKGTGKISAKPVTEECKDCEHVASRYLLTCFYVFEDISHLQYLEETA